MKWTPRDARGLDDVLIALSDGREVYAPVKGEHGSFRLSKSDGWRTGYHTLGDFRQTEPLKTLFFPAREFIGRWNDVSLRVPMPERIVFGVKNCDLSALSVFDHVFLQGVAEDPYYAEARRKTILVSSDCTDHRSVCFCPAVGEQPWAESGFDINISESPEGVLIEDGTRRGRELLESIEELLVAAGQSLLDAVQTRREKHFNILSEASEFHGLKPGVDLQAAVEGAFDDGLWESYAEHCVECGACNFICCTCH